MSTALEFSFKARDASGAVQQGLTTGASTMAVARALRERGWVPVDITARQAAMPRTAAATQGAATAAPAASTNASTNAAPAISKRQLRSKRTQEAVSLILRELAALLRAGVPLMRSLHLAADSSSEEPVRQMLRRVASDLDRGLSLVAAADAEHRLTGLFTPYDIAMLQVGVQTGRLPETFADMHRQREFARATAEQVATALRYPIFVLTTCALALVVINIFVIPSFAKVFAQARAELPTLTLMLLGMSNAMLRWWPAGLLLAAGGTWAWTRWLAQPRGREWWDQHKLRLPVVGPILDGIVMARLSGALASSLSAGLTLSDALTVAGRTLGNQWYESKLQQMCASLARGVSITAAARQMGVLPPTMLQLFAIGEESGSLEELMAEISQHYQSEVDYAVKRLSATIEPLLIWFLGGCVLVLALGVFMPMWDLGRAAVR